MATKREETTRKTTAKNPAAEKSGEKTFTQADVDRLIAAAVEKAIAAAEKPTVTYVKEKEDKVTLIFFGGIAKGTVVPLEGIGKITRDGGSIDVPKSVFLQNISPVTESLLNERKLIVASGLDEDERERYGVNYKEDELLTVRSFHRLLDYQPDELLEVFKKLCPEHQKLVARIFISAYYEKNDNRVTLKKVKEMNDLTKKDGKDGFFTPLLKDLAERFAE